MHSHQSDDIETRYNLISSTEEIALSKLPKREMLQHTHISSDVRVRKIRKDLQRMKQSYEQKLIGSTFKDTAKTQRILSKARVNADAE